MKRYAETFDGTNSATPSYFKAFSGESVSYNAIRQENPHMVEAFRRVVTARQHPGQLTLDGDIIYPPFSHTGALFEAKTDA